MTETVRDNKTLGRFELEQDGHVAAAYYDLAGNIITFTHTEVPDELGGKGVGSRLVKGALDQVVSASFLGFEMDAPAADARQEPYGKITPRCEAGPFPGWYVLSVNVLHLQNHSYDYFREFEPVDWIGNALAIYHITSAEANRVRAKLGLAEIRDDVSIISHVNTSMAPD